MLVRSYLVLPTFICELLPIAGLKLSIFGHDCTFGQIPYCIYKIPRKFVLALYQDRASLGTMNCSAGQMFHIFKKDFFRDSLEERGKLWLALRGVTENP